MIATGIVRRIDDLGRVVIPAEIRKQLKIREGDKIEFFLDFKEGNLICRKALTEAELLMQNFLELSNEDKQDFLELINNVDN